MTVHAVSNGTIAESVRDFIVSNLLSGEMEEELHEDDLLFEGGIIDSGSVVSLVTFLEVRYGIQIRDEDLFAENFATIERIATFVQKRQRG